MFEGIFIGCFQFHDFTLNITDLRIIVQNDYVQIQYVHMYICLLFSNK